MHRLTIPSLTTLLVVAFAMGAQGQPTGTSQPPAPKAPQSQSPSDKDAAHDAQAKALKRHRIILLHVDEVIAADTGEGIDERLLPMGGRLESLFSYTTYRLISHQVGRTECGGTAAFTLPGGWIVHVEPSAVRDNMIAMELMLFQGARPMMTTDVRMRNHGMLIIGGPHYQQGMLIIPIGADAPELAMPPAPIPVSPESTTPDVMPPEMTAPGAGTPDAAEAGSPQAGPPTTPSDDAPAPNAPSP